MCVVPTVQIISLFKFYRLIGSISTDHLNYNCYQERSCYVMAS